MSKLVFSSSFDFSTIDLSQFTDGSIDSISSSEIDLSDGDYSARVLGENFDFAGNGTVHEIIGSFQSHQVFDLSGLNITLAELNADRDDGQALIDDFFGGKDSIKGSNDKVHGDGLYGFGGNDVINGGKGGDTISGGAGRDAMTGGQGDDTFLFSSASDSSLKAAKADLITDLEDKFDHIDLTAFHIKAKAVVASYDSVHDLTTFAVDTNGDHKADFLITASGDHHAFHGFVF
jgi:Ca2+-binding RTX toxin-like protein